jgi:hypothetical protein
MHAPSDLAELSTLRAQLTDLTERMMRVADDYRSSPDSAVTSDLDSSERSLLAARRALDRAMHALSDLAR